MASALAVIALLLVAASVGCSLAAIRFRTLADQAERATGAERWERYRANIAAAASALQLQNAGAARRALDEPPEGHRNWEWRRLHNQLDGAQAVLRGHDTGVWRASFSPDGKRLLSHSSDGTTRLWDRATGKELRRLRQPEGLAAWGGPARLPTRPRPERRRPPPL